MRVYGPYRNREGRLHVIFLHDDKTRKTVSYPKYVFFLKYGWGMEDWVEIHHKDGDPLNNDPANLMAMTKQEHLALHRKPEEMYVGICPVCGDGFEKKMRNVKRNLSKGRRGPYCSRSCAGKAGKK